MLLRVQDRWFAITFGPGGRFLLDSTAVEQRFGLLVVLNSIPENQVRSIDKTALDALATHSRVQTSREASPIDFGLDVERDLVRAVTGTPADNALGQRLHGVDTLVATVRTELSEVPSLLARYLARHRSIAYKRNFPWVDHIAEVKDADLRTELDQALLAMIHRSEFDACWLAVPEIVDWDRIDGFRYGRRQRNAKYHDIDLRSWLNEMNEISGGGFSSTDVTLRLLSNRRILSLNTEEW